MLTEQQRAILAELETRQLSPEQQSIVQELKSRDRGNDLAPDEDTRLNQQLKFSEQMRAQGTPVAIPGGPFLPGMVAPPIMEEGRARDMVATKVAESLGEKQVNPYLSAGAGMMAGYPDVVAGLGMGLKSLPGAVKNAVREGPSEMSAAGKALWNMAKKGGNRILRGPATEELANLPAKIAEQEMFAKQGLQDIGTKIEEARAAYPQNYNPPPVHGETPAEVAESLNKIAKTPTKELAAQGTKKLLEQRDAADAALRSMKFSNDEAAIAFKGKAKLDDAIMNQSNLSEAEIGARYKQYGVRKAKAEQLAKELQAKRIPLRQEAQMEKLRRKIAGYAVGGGSMLEALRRLAGGH